MLYHHVPTPMLRGRRQFYMQKPVVQLTGVGELLRLLLYIFTHNISYHYCSMGTPAVLGTPVCKTNLQVWALSHVISSA